MKAISSSLLLLFLSCLALSGQSTEIYLKAIDADFNLVDMAHDSDGNTYVLGRDGSQSVIKKFDGTGLEVASATIAISNPVALEAASNGEIYVAGAKDVRRIAQKDLGVLPGGYSIGQNGLGDMDIRDIVYVASTNRVVIGAQQPGPRWGRLISVPAVLNGAGLVTEVTELGLSEGGGVFVRSLTTDDLGNVYMVGETAGDAGSGLTGNTGYIVKYKPDRSYTVHSLASYNDIFKISFQNGWLYVLGYYPSDQRVRISRYDTNIGGANKTVSIYNPDYTNLMTDNDVNKQTFSLVADGEDNVYLTGYTVNGTTTFYDNANNQYKSIASTSRSAYVVKLNADFGYEWVKTPIQSPLPALGPNLRVSWDARNTRLWWSGSYSGDIALSMQEGSDASTRKELPADHVSQGFVSVFEPDGVFTRVVDFTLLTDHAENRVQLNGKIFASTGSTFQLIVDSNITVKTPRSVYRWTMPDGTVAETDDIENVESIVSNSDTRFTFLNFSVNSVVEDSNATVYSFALKEETTVQLEWQVEYALQVRSNFQDTASLAKRTDGTLFVQPLSSGAAGNPSPAVGKHWIVENEPVVLSINGAVVDHSTHPGLAIRYVPYSYTATGAFAAQIGNSGSFANVESRQQLPEFSMAAPTVITYAWKLQYGVDLSTSNLSADSLMLVDFVRNRDGSTAGQQTAEGSGVHWYDDGTTVRIAAPRVLSFGGAPKSLQGWFNGDNYIFKPVEGSFTTAGPNPFTADQINEGFLVFDYNGEEYIGKEVELVRPARVIWDYGDSILIKTVSIGSHLTFTPGEIADFGLLAGQKPTLGTDGDPGSDVPTPEDFIWDAVAKRFFPVRPTEMTLLWPTENGAPARVLLTAVWGPVHYRHVAGTPAVSLVPHPPAGQPNDLVFQRVAYATADGAVDTDRLFTASEAGRTVLQFNRITPSGRGGTAQSVVEIKVVETKQWNADLGPVEDAVIGQKISSAEDRAGLGTGYTYFSNARFNPFIYNRERFAGEAIWDRENPPGPVIPVNQNPSASPGTNDELVVVWYDDPALNDHLLWPHRAVRYNPVWPTINSGLGRILMSSGFGSESVGPDGNEQEVIGDITVNGETVPAATTFDPARFEQVQIYNQPFRDQPGYNPNEEHAIVAPSLRFAAVAPRPLAAYALRENDLNVTVRNANYTSDPYVLVQYLDRADNEFKMKVYTVAREDTVWYPDGFSSEMAAGEPVIPFYPLGVVSGATLCDTTYAREGDPARLTYWTDHKGTAWAVSGEGEFDVYFFYPLTPGFWWPDGTKAVGECVAWLPDIGTDLERQSFNEIDYTRPDQTPQAQGVHYTTVWPENPPILKAGETLTYAGGEYAADNPDAPGLPGVLAWAAGEVIYDDLNPDMREGNIDLDGKTFNNYSARMISALEQRTVDLPAAQFPEALLPATGRTDVRGTIYRFPELSSSLQKRIFYDPLSGKLGIKGFINDKDIGDSTLTAAPPAVYILEPNILTRAEYEELSGEAEDSPFADLKDHNIWQQAVADLFSLSRNPNNLSNSRVQLGSGYTAGLQAQEVRDPATGVVTGVNENSAQSYKALGPGLALVTNPGFLDPLNTTLPDVSYVTLAENNDPELGGSPVILHVIKIDRRERYRGAIKVVLSDNVFDENIILRHTGDFGANADQLVFDWWYRVEDGTEARPPDAIPPGQTNPWLFFPDPSGNGGEGFFQLKLKGNPQAPELLLADSLWFVRYRHRNEEPANPITWAAAPEIPFEWAGAGNSTPRDLDGDGFPDYRAQLAQGWVKRVLDAVNPYEARIRDFTGESPATYASMIRQLGQRYEGPVALNPDKDVIENVGLIELYSTILDRAKSLSIDLSTPVSTPGITNALLLASTRLADFYMLLGNEAYSDALDPTIGFGSDSTEYGQLAPTVFTFQNQLSTHLEEELALLRGVYDFKARPVYNRLFWNFTKGEGEAAYATAYNISDVTGDGFIDEDDAMVLYPQGHGDAWGHYLSAIRAQYTLLNHDYFNWVSRSELYNLQDIVFEVDFLDERKFAQVAAAKAKAGAEIVELTYRSHYVADPESQWQGYLDTDPRRAWGVEGWARRAGQGAYFDWVTANALIPSEHPNSSYTGIRKVDRTTVKDIAVISANMNAIQRTFEDANHGYNPLGIAGNTVSFDIDPQLFEGGGGQTHFEQVYERAVKALTNATMLFDNANQFDKMVRRIENSEIDFRRAVFEEDKAYRNQLIEIFGTPYSGTIGSGRAYPPGYDGPDTALYMYVDRQVRELSGRTVPTMTSQFAADLLAIAEKPEELSSLDFRSFIDAAYRAEFSPSFSSDNPSDWFPNFSGVNYIVVEDDGITFDSENARVPIGNVNLPIKASGYTFEAPPEWGQRASPGELQRHISAMIQQEAELAKAIAAWDGFQGSVVRQLRLIAAQLDADSAIREKLGGKIATKTVFGLASLALNVGAGVVDIGIEAVDDAMGAGEEAVPKQLPTGGFSVSPGDALSAVRAGIGLAGGGVIAGMRAAKLALEQAAALSDLTKDLISEGLDFDIDGYQRNFALKQALVELENLVGDEGILRVEIYRQQEALRALSDEYRALLQKGARLMDAREAYNKRVAELVQRNRYQDMTFRVARNAALQQYHEAFNLAARYTYLAAKAYDYETNLHPNAPGSAQGILTDIVRERSVGFVFYGEPHLGYGGLAELLVRMKSNFDVLKGQLGLNNPQTETGRLSLRRELFRISPDESSDAAWRDVLENAIVENLWDLPEFRRYCRPFAAYDPASPEPGLVIEFSSEIISRKNFFGRNLAGGDHAYDPTNFSTKIASVGAWFEGYLSSDFANDLSETPRIYLVPVGTDIMAYPSDTDLGVRLWDVLDQKIPVPYPVQQANLDSSTWRPLDTLGGTQGEIRKFSSFRAYHDSGYFDQSEMTFDTRLVGRSVWNTRWLLIIPGATLKADADSGLNTFVENITDIKLFFQTYGFSGN